ncbi:MAG: SDR family oxidoreductase [Actinomycetota bacterium]
MTDPDSSGPPVDPAAAPPENYARYPSLVDRSVLVTGGADGVGAGIVEQFAKQGSRVGFLDIQVDKAAETIARCEEVGAAHTPLFYECDLTDISALRSAIESAQTDLDGIEVLVNNAAADDRHTWDEVEPEYFDDRIAVNLRHYFFAIQAVAPRMIETGAGSIVNIGSSSFMMQEDFFPGYAIAKSGVSGITRTMARTFGPHGVRVNTVLPGWVATEKQLTRWWTPEGEAGTLRDQAIKRRIYPAEFAQMVLFLAADDGGACTAQEFLVDGGRF